MDTGRGALHTDGGIGEGEQEVGSRGEITWGKMPDIGDRGMEAANYIAMYIYPCNNPACSAHVPQNLKYNKKKKVYLAQ